MPRAPISFDFDDTLVLQPSGIPIHWAEAALHRWARAGHPIIIVTARYRQHVQPILEHVHRRNLPVSAIYATDNGLKGPLLRELGAKLHYDDQEVQLHSARKHGVFAIQALPAGPGPQ